MDCHQLRPLLVRYVDNELAAEQRAAVERHLQDCETCRGEAETLRVEARLYATALPNVPAPEGLEEEVMKKLAEPAARPLGQYLRLPRLSPKARLAPALAVAGALLLLIAFGMPAMLVSKHKATAPPAALVVPAEQAQRGPEAAKMAQGLAERRAPLAQPEARPAEGVAQARASLGQAQREAEVYRAGLGAEAPAAPPAGVAGPGLAGGGPTMALAPAPESFTQLSPYGTASDASAPVLMADITTAAKLPDAWVREHNLYITPPAAVTEDEVQGALDRVLVARAYGGGMYDWDRYRERVKSRTGPLPVVGTARPSPGAPRPIGPESTDAEVTLSVYYKDVEESWVTTYQAQFEGTYDIQAPESKRKGVRIELTFPFPPSASTIQNAKLTVKTGDGYAEDTKKTTYSLAGVRWAGWFEPEERKTLRVAYRAYGKGDYIYALPKDMICKRLSFAVKVENLPAGMRPELAPESLRATSAPLERKDENVFKWSYADTVTRRDIHLRLPERTAVTPMLQRIVQYTDEILPLCRYAPLLLLFFLGGISSSLNRTRYRPRAEPATLLAIAFLSFFPLYMFTAAYLEPPGAFGLSLGIVLALAILYALLTGGPRFAAAVAFFGAICLGAFGYALIKPELRGLIFTVGGLLILVYFMLGSALRMRAEPAKGPAEQQ